MKSRFVSEAIKLIGGEMDSSVSQAGAPGVPTRFIWRDEEVVVEKVVDMWRETGACSSSSGARKEMYARKHWFQVVTTDGREMRLYYERQPRSRAESKKRWWLHSILEPEETSGGEAKVEG